MSTTPTAPTTPTPTTPQKRRRLGLQVSVEAGADGKPPVHQVFSDGTYLPASDSHFDRTSAAASAFVYRSLASGAPASASAETNATDSHDTQAQWAQKAFVSVDGSIYELRQFLAAIEALRAQTPLLELKRTVPKFARKAATVAEREGHGMMEAKKRLANRSADFLLDRVNALEKWIEKDNAFCEAFLSLRKLCNGVRRRSNSTPLIDVGDGDYVPVLRPPDLQSPSSTQLRNPPGPLPVEEDKVAPVLRVEFPAATYLKFAVSGLDEERPVTPAPVVQENERSADDQSIRAVIRRVRLARVSAFRRRTFDQMAKEAPSLPLLTERTTNTMCLQSGPRDFLRIEKTRLGGTAPSLDTNTDPHSPVLDDFGDMQTASLLQIIAIRSCLSQTITVFSYPPHTIMERVIDAAIIRGVMQETEKILDSAVNMLRVRLEWTRGTSRVEESRVRVFSASADGDGPDRALITVEPISRMNNSGIDAHNAHVRILPAFGVVIPAPDDPGARGRMVAAVPPPSSHQASNPNSNPNSPNLPPYALDDIPRSYVCPVGPEILSVLSLLLCGRLLDALETEARAGQEEFFDVDRQCFTVIVYAPTNGHTLKAKVWPTGSGVGDEIPLATAWFDGHKIRDFPAFGPGRVDAWKSLLRKLVAGDVDTGKEKKITEEDDMHPTCKPDAMQVESPHQKRPTHLSVARAVGPGMADVPPAAGSALKRQFPFSQPEVENANQFHFNS